MNKADHVVQPEAKDYSVAALVLGIISLLFAFSLFLGVLLGILAIVFGVLSLKSAGRGKAIAGIILGSLGIIFSFLVIVIIVLAVPALQKSSRNTARLNDAALISSRVAEYRSFNNGKLPSPYSFAVSGMTQITSIDWGGEPTKVTAIYSTGKNCGGGNGERYYTVRIMQEDGTIICIDS